MTTPTRRRATEARREQIISAAVALLAERGCQATTFDAICERAGLSSKRLITYHFAGKEELFTAIAAKVVADAEAFMRPALDAATGARELLITLIRANVTFMAGHLEQMKALQQIIFNGGHAWDEHHTDSVNRLAGLFTDGQRSGAFRPCNAQVMAVTLRAALDGVYEPLAEGIDPARCAEELVEIFDRATRAAG
ncbi:TetR/AcrR family transcriptional regulator [Actinomycetota bacterium Odt1-20B]